MIAKSLIVLDGTAAIDKDNQLFRQICRDILASETSRVGSKTNQDKVKKVIDRLIDSNC